MRGKAPDQLSPYEALMRGFGYHHRLSPAEHAEARDALERAVEAAPANADCWAMLSWIYSHEYGHGFNPRPGSLDRALAAARRAVDLAPSNHLAQQALAVALFFRKETRGLPECRANGRMALNPLDGSNEAIFLDHLHRRLGARLRVDRVARWSSIPIIPAGTGRCSGSDEYRKANYRAAMDEIVKANVPVLLVERSARRRHGQLGEATPRGLRCDAPARSEAGLCAIGGGADRPVVRPAIRSSI